MKIDFNDLGLKFFYSRTDKDFTIYMNATKRFYTSLGHSLYRISHTDLDDILSFFYTNVYNKIHQFNPEYKFNTWTGIIFRHECIAFLRRLRTRSAMFPLYDNMVKFEYTEDDVNKEELYTILAEQFEHIPLHYVTVLNDKYVLHLTLNEIADKYKVDKHIVKNNMFQAKRILKLLVTNEFTIEDIHRPFQSNILYEAIKEYNKNN